MKKKIVVLPLDERPCNYYFNQWLVKETDYSVVVPPFSLLGKKKTIGDIEGLVEWLFKESADAYGLVIAIDTLLYSGIIPSRLHYDDVDTLNQRLNTLKTLKEKYPHLVIYGYNLIMRNPKYSSNEEEPDYYETWGREIHLHGVINHKLALGIATRDEENQLKEIDARLPLEHLHDYLDRRAINLTLNKSFLKLIQEGVIDFGIVPQDDSSPYGLTAVDQKIIRETIIDLDIALKAYMYPGADEVTNTLLARLINYDLNIHPNVYIKYTSELGAQCIPLYEDRPVGETVKYQVLAAGGKVVSSLSEADLVLLMNTPGGKMVEAASYKNRSIEYNSFRNLIEGIEFSLDAMAKGKGVIIGDIAYANGGDFELLKLLKQASILYRVAGYAGWNTSSNTLGTAIPQGFIYHIYGNTKAHKDFLALRYTEDIGYCSFVRQEVTAALTKTNLSYRELDGPKGKTAQLIKDKLQTFADSEIVDPTYKVTITDSYQPWNRMFEIGLFVTCEKK
ncbi:MAG: DUF4127 family protein [Candidatus Izemoplasmataceae bacterium]